MTNILRNTLFALIALLCFACKPSEPLTREQAAAAINEYYKGQMAYETFSLTQGGAFTESVREKFVELQNAGLITFTEQPDEDGTSLFTATLTPKGSQYILEDRGDDLIIKHANLTLGEVRTITLSEDQQQAQVKYTLKYYNLTPWGALNGVEEKLLDAEDKLVNTGDKWTLQSPYVPKRFE
jgi:hypothetical protein